MRMAWFSVAWKDAQGKMQSSMIPAYSKEDAMVRFSRSEPDYREMLGVTIPGNSDTTRQYEGAMA